MDGGSNLEIGVRIPVTLATFTNTQIPLEWYESTSYFHITMGSIVKLVAGKFIFRLKDRFNASKILRTNTEKKNINANDNAKRKSN